MYKEDVGEFLNRCRASEAKKYLQQAVLLLKDAGNYAVLLLKDAGNYDEIVDIVNETIERIDDND